MPPHGVHTHETPPTGIGTVDRLERDAKHLATEVGEVDKWATMHAADSRERHAGDDQHADNGETAARGEPMEYD